MSAFEGPMLKGMNPFSNNKPRLTASERIRDKRDATIYQAEKQRFQNKKCGTKNVAYYKNGTIRRMSSYKIQKSLARGSVLCEDCDDKGLLCNNPSDKDQLGQIKMGNNYVSEYWGGASLTSLVVNNSQNFTVMTDASGHSNQFDSSGVIDYFFYGDLVYPSTSGITIDPSNILFSGELCDPFRYLKKTNLKTYLVITSNIQNSVHENLDCHNSLANIVSEMVNIDGINGMVKSVCCVAPEIFDIYVELFYIDNYDHLGYILKNYTTATVAISGSIFIQPIQNIRIFQGTIPTKQTRYNATQQSYMSCLENGTRKINFTAQNIIQPVINSFCGPIVE